MYQYDIRRVGIGGFTREVPKKSKRYSLNRKALEKKRYPVNNTISQSNLSKRLDLTSGVPENACIEQSDASSATKSMSYVPLPPSISQEHFLGIIGELNKAFMKNNLNDAPTEDNHQMNAQLVNSNDNIQDPKFIGTSGISAPIAQPPDVCTSARGIPCVSQNSFFPHSGDVFGLRQLERNINHIATISSQDACANASGIINGNTAYVPHGNTIQSQSNSMNAGMGSCIASPMFPQETFRAPVPQPMCGAMSTNYLCAEQNRLPYVPADCAMFVERIPQQNVWHSRQMPPPPNAMGFWNTQGTACSIPFIHNMPTQDGSHLPNFPMLHNPVPYQTAVETVPLYPTLW